MAKIKFGVKVADIAARNVENAIRISDTADLIEGVGVAAGIGAAIMKVGAEVVVAVANKKH